MAPEESTGIPVSIRQRPMHPQRGVQRPTAGTPDRAPGSVRRTSTIDSARPEGLDGPVVQVGTARDLSTNAEGHGEVVQQVELSSVVQHGRQSTLLELSSTPDEPGLQALVGKSVAGGFRKAVTQAVPHHAETNSLLHLLLDDLPGATLVSGYARGAAAPDGYAPPSFVENGKPRFQMPDLCAGFQTGGTFVSTIENDGYTPVATGPDAPSFLSPTDPLAWHQLPPLDAHDMRRSRRLDVIPGPVVTVHAFFRDTYMAPDGIPTVVHEYTMNATVDPDTLTILSSEAHAGALPWVECIEAEPSGGWLPGKSLEDLRRQLGRELRGVHTCTHLNDTMRSLEDVLALMLLLGH